jgi:hypothetical protein
MGLLVANNPISSLMAAVMVVGYMSYDTTPWSEAVGGLFLIGASRFLWLTDHRDTPPHSGGGDAAVPGHARLTQTS